MNVIEALKTLDRDLDQARAQYSRLTLEQCISQLERAEADLRDYPPPYFTASCAAASALRHITGDTGEKA